MEGNRDQWIGLINYQMVTLGGLCNYCPFNDFYLLHMELKNFKYGLLQ